MVCVNYVKMPMATKTLSEQEYRHKTTGSNWDGTPEQSPTFRMLS